MARKELPTGDFVTSALSGALAQSATTATIGTGLELPATLGMLHLDYDSSIAIGTTNGPETVYYATYTTATGGLTGLTRGANGTTDVAHDSGQLVAAGVGVQNIEELQNGSAFDSNATLKNMTYRARASAAANQAIGTGSWTKVTLGTETYDSGSDFATSAYTAPVTGYYLVSGAAQVVDIADGKTGMLAIYVDGTEKSRGNRVASGAATYLGLRVTDIIYLTAAEVVTLYVYHDHGSNRNVAGSDESTYLAIHALSID